jgi:uncharacterized GH25 family protein
MRKLIALTIVLVATLAFNAHEFWLQPAKFRFALGETIRLDFMAGESFAGEFWDLKKHHAEKMELHRLSGIRDLTSEVKPTQGNNLVFKADQEGTYLFSLKSNAAYIELEGDEFNDYLKEDGLDNIIDERTKSGRLNRKATEYYSRYAKVLIQAGDKTDDTFKNILGFRYEIIPNQNPYTLKAGDYLDCRVLFDGKPAAHALVKVWNRVGTTTFLQNIYTEKDGSMRFPISASGPWMVSSVRMIHSETAGAEYHSLWASLVFGI